MPDVLLTVVIAAYNEAETLPLLQPRIAPCSTACAHDRRRRPRAVCRRRQPRRHLAGAAAIAAADARVSLLRLSRNFGKEAALTAGLDRVDDGAALILDADGQDPPELIPQFVAKWREGFDDVHGTRAAARRRGLAQARTAHAFYRLIGRLSKTPIPERHRRFPPAVAARAGRAAPIARTPPLHEGPVRLGRVRAGRDPLPARAARSPAAASSTSGSCGTSRSRASPASRTAPLRLATYLGVVTALLAFVYALWIVVKALLWGDPVAGWPTMMVGDPVPRRRAADRAGPDRRIPRPPVHRIQAAPAVPRRRLAAGDGSILGRSPIQRRRRPCARYATCSRRKRLRSSRSGPDAPVLDAIRLMADKRIGALLVMEAGRLVGIVSERDYARKIVLQGRSSKDTPVRDIMTADVISVGLNDTADHCMQLVTDKPHPPPAGARWRRGARRGLDRRPGQGGDRGPAARTGPAAALYRQLSQGPVRACQAQRPPSGVSRLFRVVPAAIGVLAAAQLERRQQRGRRRDAAQRQRDRAAQADARRGPDGTSGP